MVTVTTRSSSQTPVSFLFYQLNLNVQSNLTLRNKIKHMYLHFNKKKKKKSPKQINPTTPSKSQVSSFYKPSLKTKNIVIGNLKYSVSSIVSLLFL